MEQNIEFDWEIINDMYPAYIIRECTKEIVYVNHSMKKLMGRDVVGELCFRAVAKRTSPCHACPLFGSVGGRQVWEYYHAVNKKLFKVCQLFVRHQEEDFRISMLVDVSDVADLGRYTVKYLSLMSGLSEMQAEILENPADVFAIILKFLKKQFHGRAVILTYPCEGQRKLLQLTKDETIEEKMISGNETELIPLLNLPAVSVKVLENTYEFRIWLEKGEQLWEENKKIVFDVIKLYLENAAFKKEVEWEVKHDGGTRLFNRAHFMHQARVCYAVLHSIGIIYLDIDNLKQVNDSQGHAAGDILIGRTAGILKGISGEQIHSYRIGGDEFAVVFCNCSLVELEKLAAELHTVIKKNNMTIQSPMLSISLGYAYGCQPFSVDAVLQEADAAMYVEKRKKKQERCPNTSTIE